MNPPGFASANPQYYISALEHQVDLTHDEVCKTSYIILSYENNLDMWQYKLDFGLICR